MKIIPIKNTVLCKKNQNEKESSIKGILILNKKEVDTYKIISVSSDDDEYIFKPDDEIIVSGSGDLIEIDGEDFYLFKTENVVAKIYN